MTTAQIIADLQNLCDVPNPDAPLLDVIADLAATNQLVPHGLRGWRTLDGSYVIGSDVIAEAWTTEDLLNHAG